MKLKLLVTSMAVFFATCGEVMAAAGFLRGKDTSCAVVLYNGARYAMEASLDDVFVRKSYHRKVKILTEEAGHVCFGALQWIYVYMRTGWQWVLPTF